MISRSSPERLHSSAASVRYQKCPLAVGSREHMVFESSILVQQNKPSPATMDDRNGTSACGHLILARDKLELCISTRTVVVLFVGGTVVAARNCGQNHEEQKTTLCCCAILVDSQASREPGLRQL